MAHRARERADGQEYRRRRASVPSRETTHGYNAYLDNLAWLVLFPVPSLDLRLVQIPIGLGHLGETDPTLSGHRQNRTVQSSVITILPRANSHRRSAPRQLNGLDIGVALSSCPSFWRRRHLLHMHPNISSLV